LDPAPCPISGKKLDLLARGVHIRGVTSTPAAATERLQALLGLRPDQARRAVAEVLDTFQLEVDQYIARRHGELQAEGASNPEIFERIASELPGLRFRAPPLTPRQIRRRIYG
jgi:hypothetical protein